MAGGQGARMRPYTTVLPKPLLPVGDRPILAILIEQLAAAGVTRVDICLGHLGELIEAYLAQTPPATGDAEIRFNTESQPLGTAGALREVKDLDEPFLLLNGDVLTSLDFNGLMAGHRDSGADLTVTVRTETIEVPSGVLTLDGELVTAYDEKPVIEHEVSTGIYVLSPDALGYLPGGRVDVPDLVEELLRAGRRVGAHRLEGSWFDIGTPEDHRLATSEFLASPGRYLPGLSPS
jgi:NDP-mannose synthase